MFVFALAVCLFGADLKNGIYGSPSDLPQMLQGRGIKYRVGAPRDIVGGIYTVGKLDGNTVGPFEGESTEDIAKFTSIMLSSRPKILDHVRTTPQCIELEKQSNLAIEYGVQLMHCVNAGGCKPAEIGFSRCYSASWYNLCNSTWRKNLALSFDQTRFAALCIEQQVEKTVMDAVEYAANLETLAQVKSYEAIMGELRSELAHGNERNLPLYRDQLLSAQFNAEWGVVKSSLESAVTNGKRRFDIEVANESNLYPYIPPRQYAGYYLQWVDALKSLERDLNAAGKNVSFKFMPGGLGDVSGLPLGMQKLMKEGARLNVSAFGVDAVDIRVPKFLDQLEYYKLFIAEIARSRDPKAVIDYANLHFYPHPIKCDEVLSYDYSYCDDADGFGFGQTRMVQILAKYQDFLNYAVENSSTGTALVSEFGSILPYSPKEMAERIVQPMEKWLNGNSSLQWWAWFKAKGDDSKLSMITSTDWAGVAKLSQQVELMMGGSLPRKVSISGVTAGLSFDQDGYKSTISYFENWKRIAQANSSTQGLVSSDGSLNEAGKSYFRPQLIPIWTQPIRSLLLD